MTDEPTGLPARWLAARSPRGWSLLDAALAALFLVLLVTEIVPNPEMTPSGQLLALAALVGGPVAWRSSHPAFVAVLVSAAHLVMSLVSTGPFSPQLAVLPVLVVLYSAAGGTRGWTSVVTGAVTLALTVAAWGVTQEGEGDDFWPWMLWLGAWAAGTFVRRRGDLAAHHAGRAARLEVEAAESAQRERDRITRELHDIVAHSVSVMVVQAGAERLRLGPDAGRTGTALEAIEETGRLALAEMRTMLGVLRERPASEPLAPLPGVADIPTLVDRVRDAGLPVELTMPAPDGHTDRAAAGLAAYRIVQEALTNVVRHAGPVGTRVSVQRDGGRIDVTVTNAAGHPTGEAGSGHGLVGMRERTLALSGSFDAGSSADGGFRVRAVLPLAADQVVP